MAKEMLILAVSVVTLLVAGFGAYSVTDMGNNSQSASAEIKDYTEEFQSLQITLGEVKEQLNTLENETVEEIAKIKTELEEVKSLNTEPQVTQSTQILLSPFSIFLDKATYAKGEPIQVTATGVSPQKSINIELLSSFNEVIVQKTAFSDSTGKLAYTFSLPSFVGSGNYQIRGTFDGQGSVSFITISDSVVAETQNNVNAPAIFAANLDKTTYAPGEMIKITGTGEAKQGITSKLVSPDEESSLTANSSSTSDGEFTLIYILDSQAQEGNWKLTVTQGDKTNTYTVTVKK